MNEPDAGALVLAALAELRGIKSEQWVEGTVRDRAIVLDRVRELSRVLADATTELELSLIDSMESDELLVPGVGLFKRVPSRSSTWRDGDASRRMRKDLARAVADHIALDVATGELDEGKRNVALATMREALDVIPAFSSLKQGSRERFGLDIEDYRTFTTYYSIKVEAAL